ncbi:hypothetical protein [uncultured Erythrobacter sp.]|uniref:hypothetical protein n=1 Tax=uncultured Erythrobacter sp. TaxID=263913 RepID=UPI00260FD735|nr:hypothetical protein [uncultured Erythrobacter sp.]
MDHTGDQTRSATVDTILRDELARANRALSGVAPVISHMLESSGHALVSDAIVARLRGMLGHLANQLLSACQPDNARGPVDRAQVDAMSDALAGDSKLLNHLYAVAMEGHLTERLQQRSSLDPVLSSLLQELIASDQPAVAELAMASLAAQSRFMQSQRRMELPLAELPPELLLSVLERFCDADLPVPPNLRVEGAKALKAEYDEGAGRLGLLARLVTAMREGAIAALELDHAGLALFASAVASRSKQPRDLAILACHERQAARLALSLRASGLEAEAIERQFLLLEPAQLLPEEIAQLAPERALELLNASGAAISYSNGAG